MAYQNDMDLIWEAGAPLLLSPKMERTEPGPQRRIRAIARDNVRCGYISEHFLRRLQALFGLLQLKNAADRTDRLHLWKGDYTGHTAGAGGQFYAAVIETVVCKPPILRLKVP